MIPQPPAAPKPPRPVKVLALYCLFHATLCWVLYRIILGPLLP